MSKSYPKLLPGEKLVEVVFKVIVKIPPGPDGRTVDDQTAEAMAPEMAADLLAEGHSPWEEEAEVIDEEELWTPEES